MNSNHIIKINIMLSKKSNHQIKQMMKLIIN